MKEKATIFDYARMCKNAKTCDNCPLGLNINGANIACSYLVREIPDKANEIILNWCKEHPVETRQDRFLKMFPNAKIDNDGVIAILPCSIDKHEFIKSDFPCPVSCEFNNCAECRKNYWLAEVKENE